MAFGLGKNTKDTKKKNIKKPSRAAGETGRRMTRRMIAFGSIVAGLSVLLIGRLFVLQITDYEKYQSKVISQLTRETTTTPERGKIYDTNMNLLATNTTVYRVAISPYDIAGGDEVFKNISDEDMDAAVASLTVDAANNQKAQIIARKCEEMFGVSYDTTMQKAAKVRRRDETITKNVDPDVAAELRTFIQENELQGMLNLYAESKRYYCYGDLACHVIGFTNSDGNGVYGVEATYNEYLKGTNGKYITAKDSVGKSMPFKYESYINAENGANLVVTIDLKIQYDLETQVQAAYDSAQAGNRVCGIAMDPNTGAILAMAVYPNYDLNSPYELAEEFLTQLNDSGYAEDSDEYSELKSDLIFEMWNNKCVSETYEPGSTFKILTAAAALEEGAVKVDDTFYCPGWYLGEGFSQPISCHRTAGHGTVTFARGLQQSCNPTLMMTAERLGLDKFYKYFEAFGYTGKTGVDLPGEVYGIYHDKSEMHPTELACLFFRSDIQGDSAPAADRHLFGRERRLSRHSPCPQGDGRRRREHYLHLRDREKDTGPERGHLQDGHGYPHRGRGDRRRREERLCQGLQRRGEDRNLAEAGQVGLHLRRGRKRHRRTASFPCRFDRRFRSFRGPADRGAPCGRRAYRRVLRLDRRGSVYIEVPGAGPALHGL